MRFLRRIRKADQLKIDIHNLEIATYKLINCERRKNGLKSLKWSTKLGNLARSYSKDMALQNFFGHKDLQGRYLTDRLSDSCIDDWFISAENLAKISRVSYYCLSDKGEVVSKVYKTPTELVMEVVKGWMNSLGHRHNILAHDFTETGIGVAASSNNEDFYFTQIFVTDILKGRMMGRVWSLFGGPSAWKQSPRRKK